MRFLPKLTVLLLATGTVGAGAQRMPAAAPIAPPVLTVPIQPLPLEATAITAARADAALSGLVLTPLDFGHAALAAVELPALTYIDAALPGRAAIADAASQVFYLDGQRQGVRMLDDVRAPVLPAPRPGAAVEPADSLYRLARAALNDGDYKKAASLFQTVVDKYPDSEFAPDALYYRAYALYKVGTSRELELAVQALDRQAARYPKAGTLNDAKQLRGSIMSEQAKRGNSDAAMKIFEGAKMLSTDPRCPTEDDETRIIAFSAIIQQDPDAALPLLQKVLERKDECSVKLRRSAVYLLAQTKEEERSDILLRVASSDPNMDLRREAIQGLAQVNTERAARALDSILFTGGESDIRERAIYALAQHRSPSARQSLRRFAEAKNMSTDLRARAILYIAQTQRSGGDESEFFKSLFGKTASPELREALIQGIARQRSPDRASWLLGVARDKNYEIDVRKKALFYAGQAGVELKDLLSLYDAFAGQTDMQEQMLYVYSNRKETEATDKLLSIAKSEKNPDLRRKAISWLGPRSKDPRVKQFLLDLLAQ